MPKVNLETIFRSKVYFSVLIVQQSAIPLNVLQQVDMINIGPSNQKG